MCALLSNRICADAAIISLHVPKSPVHSVEDNNAALGEAESPVVHWFTTAHAV
jgi:hypothetical protein